MKKLLVALLGIAACSLASAEVPLKDFAKRPDFYDVKISPNGEYIALRVPDGDQTGIAVMQLSPLKLMSKISMGDHRTVGGYWWVGPNRLVATPAIQWGLLEQPALTGELFGFDADGKNQKYLFGYQGGDETSSRIKHVTKTYGWASILRTLSNDPLHAIVSVSNFSDSVDSVYYQIYRLNVENGFLDHPDSSPVAGPSRLLADRDGALRFATGTKKSPWSPDFFP